MKQVIKPAQKEIAEYVSDFSNNSFDGLNPEVEIKFEFNYGSEFDGSSVEFHLTDSEAKHVLDFIRKRLSKNKIKEFKDKLECAKVHYDDNVQSRDWASCNYFGNCADLFRYLINENNKS